MTTLSSVELSTRMDFAVALVQRAGALALGYFRDLESLHVQFKGPQDHVSEADVLTERLIRDAIAERFPQDAFVGEESGESLIADGDAVWVVDPIDGTQPFLLDLPTWCVSIAVVANGDIQIGVVFNPVTGELYAARRGGGATLNGRVIHVRAATSLADGLTTVGCSPRTTPADLALVMERLLSAGGMFHRTGSGALSLSYLAAGRTIGYLEMHINAWDCLAAVLLVEEAGGRVSPFLAENGVAGGGPLVAGSADVYEQLQGLLPSR